LLNPVNHALDEAEADRYRVEPYVVAADVYSSSDKGGRGGWTWYTGSAGWMYRAAVESILGIRRRGETLVVSPVLPSHWNGFNARRKLGDAVYRLIVQRTESGEPHIEIDGEPREGNEIPLRAAGTVEIRVSVPE